MKWHENDKKKKEKLVKNIPMKTFLS